MIEEYLLLGYTIFCQTARGQILEECFFKVIAVET
jgi:hypothetical protein